MPKKFVFEVNQNVMFEGNLHSMQCEGLTKSGSRCKRRCVIGLPYCWSHLQSEMNLKIKDSTIPDGGKGVFAQKKNIDNNVPVFKSNDIITEYKGETITPQQKNQRYGNYTAPYTVY